MNLFTKLLLAALVLAMLLPFTILKNDQGKPMMSFSSFSLPELPDFSSGSTLKPSSSVIGGKDIFYKWYDADGNVQFTTEPPPDGVEYTVKGYDPNTNVIQAVKLPKEEVTVDEPAIGTFELQPELNSYDPQSIQKLMEDTRNIEKLLNQRFENQNSALNQ
jgi:hypothetical protein